MLILRHSFHTSSRWLQRPAHPLYQVIDWTRVDAGHYAVVDPLDNHAILYLSEKAYQVQVRVSLSQDSPLIKLAGPGDRPVTSSDPQASSDSSSSQNSPNPIRIGKSNAKLWKKFLSWHLSSLGRLGQQTNAKRTGGPTSTKASIDLSAAVLRTLIPYFGLDVHFRLGGDLDPPRELVSTLRDFADRMVRILEGSGAQYLILYLKNTLFYLNKYASGNPATSYLLEPPVSLARSGIPRIIPLLFRRRLANKEKDLFAYRLVNTLLNSFRAMEGTHAEQTLDSILNPHPKLDENELVRFRNFCKEVFWPKVIKPYLVEAKKGELMVNVEDIFRIKDDSGVYIPSKAGPNANPGLLGAQIDADLWSKQETKGLRNYPLEWCRHVGDTRTPEVFSACLGPNNSLVSSDYYSDYRTQPSLGKVQCLPEPAGKVRTIAIVDYWTQRLMSPVHDWMMAILRCLPTDGTFDQGRATELMASRHTITGKTAYSIDLKSATDMIPIELYRAVFAGIWREETVNLWIGFLTDRWFLIPPKEKLVASHLRGCSIRYGRGQPMGTLSSWPSMALVHHALELFSAQTAGYDPGLFVDYAILGDDNITLGTDVANAYVAVAEKLCVPTSPAKTLSGNLFIFAQQIFLHGKNISPLSLKEELGIRNFGERLELALRAIRRGWLENGLTLPRFLRLLLTRVAYRHSVREWSVGRLGNIAKSALFSAFGIASGALRELLGYQGSGFKTLLASLQGKISALAGEQSEPALRESTARRSRKRAALEKNFERLFCIVLARNLQKRLHEQVAKLEISAIRFRMWAEIIKERGVMPLFTVVPPRRGKAPELPGIAYPNATPNIISGTNEFLDGIEPGEVPGTYVWKKVLSGKNFQRTATFNILRKKNFNCFDELLPSNYLESSTMRAEYGLWVIIYDSYKELFGCINKEDRTPDPEITDLFGDKPFAHLVTETASQQGEFAYDDFEAEEDGYGGMGVTLDDHKTISSPLTGASTYKPRIVSEVRKAKLKVDGIIQQLKSADDLPAPWLDLNEIAQTLIKVSRAPDFLSKTCLYTIEARSDAGLLYWIRLGTLLSKTIAHLPVEIESFDLTAKDLPAIELKDADAEWTPRSEDLIQAKTNQGLLTGYNNSIVR